MRRLAAMLAAALLIAACGGAAEDTTTSAEQTDDSATTTAADAEASPRDAGEAEGTGSASRPVPVSLPKLPRDPQGVVLRRRLVSIPVVFLLFALTTATLPVLLLGAFLG